MIIVNYKIEYETFLKLFKEAALNTINIDTEKDAQKFLSLFNIMRIYK